LFWGAVVGSIVAIDVFIFVPGTGAQKAAIIPLDATDDPHINHLINWLGPPYFAGAREGLWSERMLEERYNVELKPLFLDATAYQRKKPLMLSGGPVPDVIWEADPLSLQSAVRHGFVAEVPLELIQRLMPGYFRSVTEEAPDAWLYSSIGGRNYGIPTFNREGSRPKPGLWRMDWLRNVGIERAPETIDEFHEALRRLTFDDPDRNGMDDTYGMSGDISNWWWVAFSEIFGAWGVIPFDWQEVDGRIVWGGVRPETRTVLKLLSDWYREGLIHPDFVTDNMLIGQSLDRKFLGGRIGYLYYRGEHMNMNPRSHGSFYSKLVNLQFESLLTASPDLYARLLRRAPDALLEHAIASETLATVDAVPDAVRMRVLDNLSHRLTAAGAAPDVLAARLARADATLRDLPANVRNWMLKIVLPRVQTRGAFHEQTFETARELPVGPALADEDAFLRLLYSEFHDTVFESIRERFDRSTFEDFSAMIAAGWDAPIRAFAAAPASATDENHSARLARVRLLTGGTLDATVARAWDWLLQRGALLRRPETDALTPLLVAHYATLLNARPGIDAAWEEPILVPAPFPTGPDGLRGARTWGKAANIIAFGRHVADDPALAARVMTMQEQIYNDRLLSRESMAGREGLHWFWADPVAGAVAGEGYTFNPAYVDPDTGTVVDLTEGSNAFRRGLDGRLGFFNLLGRHRDFANEFETTRSLEYRERWQREEWGIENALGKSDVVPSAERFLGDLRRKQQTVFAEIIRGSKPIEAYDAFVRDWYASGGQVLTDEANQVRAAQKQLLEQVRSLLDYE